MAIHRIQDAQTQAIKKQEKPNKFEGEMQQYNIKKGDNLWNISKGLLGKGASNQAIADLTQQLAKNNNVKNPDLIFKGNYLTTPKSNADKAVIHQNNVEGNRIDVLKQNMDSNKAAKHQAEIEEPRTDVLKHNMDENKAAKHQAEIEEPRTDVLKHNMDENKAAKHQSEIEEPRTDVLKHNMDENKAAKHQSEIEEPRTDTLKHNMDDNQPMTTKLYKSFGGFFG